MNEDNQFVMVFDRREGKLEKRRPFFFQVAICFQLDNSWPQALICSFSALVELFEIRLLLNQYYFEVPINTNTFCLFGFLK